MTTHTVLSLSNDHTHGTFILQLPHPRYFQSPIATPTVLSLSNDHTHGTFTLQLPHPRYFHSPVATPTVLSLSNDHTHGTFTLQLPHPRYFHSPMTTPTLLSIGSLLVGSQQVGPECSSSTASMHHPPNQDKVPCPRMEISTRDITLLSKT